MAQWIELYEYSMTGTKAESLALNKLPNYFWNNQSKWIALAHFVVGIHTTYSPQVI